MKVDGTDFVIAGEKANLKQIEFLCKALSPGDYRYFAYGGAIRGGKSYVVLFILHQLSLKYKGSKWVVVREDLPALKTTTIPSFKKLIQCERYGEWNNSPPITFRYKNGSEIIFKPQSAPTDPDLNSFLGLECSGFFLEQLEELKESMWQMAMQRSGSLYLEKTPPAYVFTTFNPTQSWVKSKFYEPWRNGTLQSPYYFQPALPKDNPFVTDDQWKAWSNMLERYQLQYVAGDWSDFVDSNNLWAFTFNRAKHIGKVAFNNTQLCYLSFDFNRNPICCSVIQWYDDRIHVVATIKLPNSNIYELCTHIRTKYPNVLYMITGDASGKSSSAMVQDNLNYYRIIKQELQVGMQQMKVPSVNPRLADNQVLVNSLLERYHIVIDEENAKGLIYDMQNVKMLPDGTIEKSDRNDPAQQADALDTFRYWCNTFMGWFIG